MAAKMKKHELEEPDKLQLFFDRVRTFAQEHRSKLYAGGAFILLVLLAGGGWYLYQDRYQKAADALYGQVIDAAAKATEPAAGKEASIMGYKELIAKYPKSRAAATAYYRLGSLHYDRGEYDAAIDAARKFLDRAPTESDLKPLAYLDIGASHEAKKELDKALESYEQALKAPASAPFEALVYGNIARIHEEKNEAAKAVEFYRKALGKTTDPLMTLYLKRKIALLG